VSVGLRFYRGFSRWLVFEGFEGLIHLLRRLESGFYFLRMNR